MEKLNENQNKISLQFIYNCQEKTTKDCRRDDIIENILKDYVSEIGKDLNSVFFVYSGETIDSSKFKLTIDQVIKKGNVILVYSLEKNMIQKQNNKRNLIIISFILKKKEVDIIEAYWYDNIKDVCVNYANNKHIEFKTLKFQHREKTIDLNKNFVDIANDIEKSNSGIIIDVYIGHPLKIKFSYQNNYKCLECFKEDKIIDIFKIYARQIFTKISDLQFYYGNILIPVNLNSNYSFNQLISYYDSYSLDRLNTNDTDYNNISEISITVIYHNKVHNPFCNEKKKRLLKIIGIVLGIVILLGGIIFLIVFLCVRKKKGKDKESSSNICVDGYFIPDDDETHQNCQKCSLEGCQKCNGTYENNECYSCGSLESIYNNDNKIIKCNRICETGDEEKCLTCYENKAECKSCNIGYKLVKGKCKADYLIKVTYLTISPNEEINLRYESRDWDISKMIIDGENVSPKWQYTFPEKGYHTVYFNFMEYIPLTFGLSTYIFSENERIVSATFLNFDEYFPMIDFEGMFSNCINLTSIDFSRISLNYKLNFNKIFYGCYNLKFVNLYNIYPNNVKNMFYNCRSLTSIDLSKISPVYIESTEYMFYNCLSLKTINFKDFYLKAVTNINYMFYNCISLESIELPNFNPDTLVYMENVFGNCISLTSINFGDINTYNVNYMDYLFYNCTSLKSINLTNFNTKNTRNFTNMFAYCTSLTSLDISNFETNNLEDISSMFFHCHSLESISLIYFITDNVKYISLMFSHCYSLKSIIYNTKNFLTNNIRNMSSLFSHCHSLTTIDLNNFNTANVIDFNNMFSHCYSLKSIDLSSFIGENVINFDSMFSHCYSLKSINISSLNSKSYSSLNNMFSGCYSLTSIDFYNFKNKEQAYYNGLFYDCPNLSFINISKFTLYLRKYDKMFNSNISSNGVLVINEDYYNDSINIYNLYIPPNWKTIFE